jgi:hypothetical protein
LIKHLRAPCPCGRLRAGRPQPGTVETTTLPAEVLLDAQDTLKGESTREALGRTASYWPADRGDTSRVVRSTVLATDTCHRHPSYSLGSE